VTEDKKARVRLFSNPVEPTTPPLCRSQFIEDLRNRLNLSMTIDLIEIKGHVVECSQDQYGSRFIQLKFE
jgi:pumilio RNA-binding family